MKSEVEVELKVRLDNLTASQPDTYMVVEYNHVMKDVLTALMRDTGGSLDDVFRTSLALYRASIDVKRAGLAVGTAGSAEDLEQEFTGFRWVVGDGAGKSGTSDTGDSQLS
jgi:hypothetical protein